MNTEISFMIMALVLMFAAVVSKIITTNLLTKMEQGINVVHHERQQILNEVKIARAQKEVAEKNQNELKRKKARLKKKINRMNEELQTIEEGIKRHEHLREQPVE